MTFENSFFRILCGRLRRRLKFTSVLEKLGTDDDELQNIADLIIKKAIRKKSQVGRLVLECSNLIEKKPLFRNIFLQNLQKSHQERKAIKKDSRENFIGLIMLLTEGKLSTFDTNREKVSKISYLAC